MFEQFHFLVHAVQNSSSQQLISPCFTPQIDPSLCYLMPQQPISAVTASHKESND